MLFESRASIGAVPAGSGEGISETLEVVSIAPRLLCEGLVLTARLLCGEVAGGIVLEFQVRPYALIAGFFVMVFSPFSGIRNSDPYLGLANSLA